MNLNSLLKMPVRQSGNPQLSHIQNKDNLDYDDKKFGAIIDKKELDRKSGEEEVSHRRQKFSDEEGANAHTIFEPTQINTESKLSENLTQNVDQHIEQTVFTQPHCLQTEPTTVASLGGQINLSPAFDQFMQVIASKMNLKATSATFSLMHPELLINEINLARTASGEWNITIGAHNSVVNYLNQNLPTLKSRLKDLGHDISLIQLNELKGAMEENSFYLSGKFDN